MKKIQFHLGDATKPVGDDIKCIMHVCNNQNGWGSGFVLALSSRWSQPEDAYHFWYENDRVNIPWFTHKVTGQFELGQVQSVKVEDDIYVFNIIGQHRTGLMEIAGIEIPPIDYRSLREGFARIKKMYLKNKFSLHAPRLGCGLAKGTWERVEEILVEVFDDTDIEINIYDLPDI